MLAISNHQWFPAIAKIDQFLSCCWLFGTYDVHVIRLYQSDKGRDWEPIRRGSFHLITLWKRKTCTAHLASYLSPSHLVVRTVSPRGQPSHGTLLFAHVMMKISTFEFLLLFQYNFNFYPSRCFTPCTIDYHNNLNIILYLMRLVTWHQLNKIIITHDLLWIIINF